jgi:UDP-N-acetylglucosamine transferase subunit ALG13
MVFVTVGNANQGFRRLLEAVDAMAGYGAFRAEEVFIQSGHNSDFHPRHTRSTPFLPLDEFQQCLEKADLIICHGGCTQITAIRLGKVPVVMPRRRKYSEHVNDHQVQLVHALASEGRIIPAYELEDLPAAIEEARRRNNQPVPPPPSRMLSLVAQAIEELIGKP